MTQSQNPCSWFFLFEAFYIGDQLISCTYKPLLYGPKPNQIQNRMITNIKLIKVTG